jgi:hypothetical protein
VGAVIPYPHLIELHEMDCKGQTLFVGLLDIKDEENSFITIISDIKIV